MHKSPVARPAKRKPPNRDHDAQMTLPMLVAAQGLPIGMKKVIQFAKYLSLLRETPKLDFYVKSDFLMLAMN